MSSGAWCIEALPGAAPVAIGISIVSDFLLRKRRGEVYEKDSFLPHKIPKLRPTHGFACRSFATAIGESSRGSSGYASHGPVATAIAQKHLRSGSRREATRFYERFAQGTAISPGAP